MALRPEVVVVGAGPAGAAAALRLARAGVRVLVLEGADFAGAENWSGCVYHAEPLLREDVLGPVLWARAPKERRVRRRALFVHDGVTAAGFEAIANAGNDFGEAWTVLRPTFDRWLMARAIDLGAAVLPGTSVTGLRYAGERVVGVNTERGPVEADVVFLAEGDAAGLAAREGLDPVAAPHYAQGIKGVFRLPAADIERRFGLAPGEGVAQEWLLRNGSFRGHPVPLNATAFLYTNRESLSLGLVLPLDRLAAHGVADHVYLFERVKSLPGIASLIEGAEQVAYGAKVIRAGGLREAVEPVRDGLAVGGAPLGLGLEFPYPNFIGPALTSGVAFADAVLALRQRGQGYGAAALRDTYVRALEASTDYANARLLRAWPAALQSGPFFFERVPAVLGQWVDALARPEPEARASGERAAFTAWRQLRAELRQLYRLSRGMLRIRLPQTPPPPLDVRFLAVKGAALKPVAIQSPLLDVVALGVGHFYGRRLPRLGERLALIWRAMLPRTLRLAREVVAGVFRSLKGGVGLAADFARYALSGAPLDSLLTRPYHRHEEASRRALDWGAAAHAPRSSLPALGFMQRAEPDRRHLSVPLDLPPRPVRALRNVCPAEVYAPASPAGGAESQYENCIKCESCRVSVPGIDWRRLSAHRLIYRVPGNARLGHDGTPRLEEPWHAPTADAAADPAPALTALARLLQERGAQPDPFWLAQARSAIERCGADAAAFPYAQRWRAWLERGAYGWIESDLRALVPRAPHYHDSVVTPDHHRLARAAAGWARLRAVFTPERLQELTTRPWQPAERETLLAWIDAARPLRADAVAWLAEWSGALAWVAACHYAAEDAARAPSVRTLLAIVGRDRDGMTSWTPACAQGYVDMNGRAAALDRVLAHGGGLDGAQPVRFAAPDSLAALTPRPELARMSLALARGAVNALRERAFDYGSSRIQFRELRDREGREGIAKFGAVKRMLARIERARLAFDAARDECERDPSAVLALVKYCAGVRMDAVPWLAGQAFGGMAYSEDDVFAPRYRDAMVLAHWPEAGRDDKGARAFERALLDARAPTSLACAAGARAVRDWLREPAPGLTPASRPVRGVLTWSPSATLRYRSGQFLSGLLLTPRELLTPEHFTRDPRLRATAAQVWRMIRRGFRSPEHGESYGRYIDRLHGLPPEDVALLKAFNAFATVVPERLGGKGWSKAEYAVLTTLLMGERDTAAALLIMASTSIGTMPVLLGLEHDLPRLARELDGLFGGRKLDALARGLARLRACAQHPTPRALKRELTAFGGIVRETFFKPGSALKYLARDFLLKVQAAVDAAKARDLDAFARAIATASAALSDLHARLEAERAGLPARRQAHERFLRFLACGQISAFALTEPVAGSDTGAIETRAAWREVELKPDGRGLFPFVPHGAAEPRVLLDAARLVFDAGTPRYRLADGTLADLDDAGWNLARNDGERALRRGSERIAFHDIGGVVERDGRLYYQYYEVSGSKMWITNGSVADRYCLYTQTEQGETGFMVERRSEGLRIGPNENKLGQRASPTNELTLARVRVSADQVIGYVGRGQVNALETLSVGRGGLVTGCGVMIEHVIREYRALFEAQPERLAEATAELERVKTLGARLVGLMDRADLDAGDFRLEAALSKYLASEGLHRVLYLLEGARGPMAAAREEPIEKWRRDARILNIYEGTNEIQRFLVLKDLPQVLKLAPTHVVDNAALGAALARLRTFAEPRLKAAGASVWQDPERQAHWFPVIDWIGELYVWCALHERARALKEWGNAGDAATLARLERLLAHQERSVALRAERVEADFRSSDPGHDPVEAALALARLGLRARPPVAAGPRAVGALTGAWTVILRSRIEWDGPEARWAGFNPRDLAALDRVLEFADAASDLRVRVAAIAPPGVEDRVRRLMAAGCELTYFEDPTLAAEPQAIARALATAFPDLGVLVIGAAPGNGEDAAFANTLACVLKLERAGAPAWLGAARRGLRLEDAGFRRHYVARARRVVFEFALKPSGRSDEFEVGAWFEALAKPLARVRIDAAACALAPPEAAPAGDVPEAFADPRALGDWLTARLGGGDADTPLRLTPAATLRDAPAVLVALGPARALDPALRLVRDLNLPFTVVVATARGASPAIPSRVAQPGFSGLVQIAVADADDEEALANDLAEALRGARTIVFDAMHSGLAARVAARVGIPLFTDVARVDGDSVVCAREDAGVTRARAPASVMSAHPAYAGRALAAVPAAVAPSLTRAAPASRMTPLARWRRHGAGAPQGLSAAPTVIDVGLGIGDAARYARLVPPLARALAARGAGPVAIGATRKVVQELKLLSADAQIGQTGTAVAPRLLFALGVSGAPQHMGWIDKNAVVIAFNRDPDAPIFRWGREHAGPTVVRCIGELDTWVPALIQALRAPETEASETSPASAAKS